MKNIHILPTDKPSRLSFDFDIQQYYLQKESSFFEHQDMVENRNIYITSDEEIKNGDWCLFDRFPKIVSKVTSNMSSSGSAKKITLTTNQDLIDDGVQAINDEFLEWFCKNPSYEEVETEFFAKFSNDLYKIIIPKEELKHTIVKETCIQCDGTGETTHPQTYNSQRVCNICNGKGDWSKKTLVKEEPKQETLEEAMIQNGYHDKPSDELWREGVEFGANWQAERMYSEEDMINASKYGYNFHKTTLFPNQEFEDSCINNTKQWLTIFKK
jgi:hypothetical protein